MFKALGDATRLTLLVRLAVAGSPQTVSEAADCCGIHLSGVSRQLAILRDAGLVRAEKQGREVRYRLNSDELVAALRGLADAIEMCHQLCCGDEE